jgi:hypothetical protein
MDDANGLKGTICVTALIASTAMSVNALPLRESVSRRAAKGHFQKSKELDCSTRTVSGVLNPAIVVAGHKKPGTVLPAVL